MTIFPLIWLGAVIIVTAAVAALRPNRHVTWLLTTILLIAMGVWISLPNNPGIHVDLTNDGKPDIDKSIDVVQGLDLAGGVQILLQADVAPGTVVDQTSMDEARRIVSERIDALGALNPIVQKRGGDRIIVEIHDGPTPIEQFSPNTRINVAAGGILGALVGFFAIFLLEYLESANIRSAEDVEKALGEGITVLGAIPSFAAEKKKGNTPIINSA